MLWDDGKSQFVVGWKLSVWGWAVMRGRSVQMEPRRTGSSYVKSSRSCCSGGCWCGSGFSVSCLFSRAGSGSLAVVQDGASRLVVRQGPACSVHCQARAALEGMRYGRLGIGCMDPGKQCSTLGRAACSAGQGSGSQPPSCTQVSATVVPRCNQGTLLVVVAWAGGGERQSIRVDVQSGACRRFWCSAILASPVAVVGYERATRDAGLLALLCL